MLKKVMYFFLIVFFILGSFLVYTVIVGLNTAEEAIAPVGDLVRQLVVPVTPVILPNPTTIVHQVNDLARLETASLELEKIVTAETNQDLLWGAFGESIIFVGYGKVVAGVDFDEMTASDLHVVDPNTIQVVLPPAQIFDDLPALDNERSAVLDRDTGLLTRADPELETQVRQAAEQAIREAAVESDILDRANANAQAYMRDFLNNLGFENVIFSDGTLPTPEPYQQPVPKGFALTPVAEDDS